MKEQDIKKLLEKVKRGKVGLAAALDRLRHLPFEDIGFAKIDHHRALRTGYPEVIFARGKTPEQIAGIVRKMLRQRHNILITRANRAIFDRVVVACRRSGGLRRSPPRFYPLSGVIAIRRDTTVYGKGRIVVVSAGTSDIPVAEEALLTAEIMGNRVEAIYDVGVAGLHRLLEHRKKLAEARVIVCVAGMEGALPSVVAGLVSVPVIAVPTSVGYGSSFEGLAALLAMLNSCASNVSVVNIDNGFGGGIVASVINRL